MEDDQVEVGGTMEGGDGAASGGDDAVIAAAPASLKEWREARALAHFRKEHPYLEHRSLGFLTPGNRFRVLLDKVIRSKPFRFFILAVIIANVVFLAIDEPNANTDNEDLVNKAEVVFIVIFTIEAVLKIAAMGFVAHPGAYLRDIWNVLDFFLVLMGLGTLAFGAANVTALRTFRILRPLRAINQLKPMKVMLNAVMGSMVGLANVSLLLLFVIFLWALVGVHLFNGDLRQQCYREVPMAGNDTVEHIGRNWTLADSSRRCGNGSTAHPCDNGTVCLALSGNPLRYISFDNTGWGILTMFTSMSTDNWAFIMYDVQDAASNFAWIFHVSFIIIATFVVMGLALTVVVNTFYDMKAAATEDLLRDYEEEQEAIEKYGWQDEDLRTPLRKRWDALVQSFKEAAASDVRAEWRRKVKAVVSTDAFEWTIHIIITLNTILLCARHHDESSTFESVANAFNLVFLILFTIEALLKLAAYGFQGYLSDGWNIFDGLLVIVGWIDFGLSGANLTAIRALRLLRVFRLARRWQQLNAILESMVQSVSAAGALSVILILFVLIFGLIGRELFAGRQTFDDNLVPRSNYDNLYWSLLTTFQVLTGDTWTPVLYNGMRANFTAAIIFYVAWWIFGTLLILNLFVAVMLEGFDVNEEGLMHRADEMDIMLEKAHEGEEWAALGSGANIREGSSEDDEYDAILKASVCQPVSGSATPTARPASVAMDPDAVEMDHLGQPLAMVEEDDSVSDLALELVHAVVRAEDRGMGIHGHDDDDDISEVGELADPNEDSEDRNIRHRMEDAFEETAVDVLGPSAIGHSKTLPRKVDADGHVDYTDHVGCSEGCWAWINRPDPDQGSDEHFIMIKHTDVRVHKPDRNRLHGKSLGLFPPTNPARRACARILFHPLFEWVISVFIVAGCVTVAMDNPSVQHCDERGISCHRRNVLDALDLVIQIVFTLEVLLKIFVLGLFRGRHAYLRSGWNWVDFLVTILSWFARPFLLALRAFRPLRLLNQVEASRKVVNAIWRGIGAAANVALASMLFWIVFAVLGVQLFGGKLYRCNDDSVMNRAECSGMFLNPDTGNMEERIWANPPWNFDNVGRAFLSLFQVSIGVSWIDIMYSTLDITGVDQQPRESVNRVAALYFIAFHFLITFYMLNLFVGAVITNFTRMRAHVDGSLFLTDAQRAWLNSQKILRFSIPIGHNRPPRQTWRKKVFWFVESQWFEVGIAGLIIANSIIMACLHYQQGDGWDDLIDISSIVFTVLFGVEVVVKLIAYGIKGYFRQPWNVFDFIIVVVSSPSNVNALQVFRLMRLMRFIRLLKFVKTLNLLINSLVYSVVSIANIGLLIFLIFYVFAIFGMELFGGTVDFNPVPGWVNFNQFGYSMLTLFRLATTDTWPWLMFDAMGESSDCVGTDCDKAWHAIFFVLFIVFTTFVMLNLILAALLESYADFQEADGSDLRLEYFGLLARAWTELDPYARLKLHASKVIPILRRVGRPLGFSYLDSDNSVIRALRRMNIPIGLDNTVHYHHLLRGLTRRSLDVDLGDVILAPDKKVSGFTLDKWYGATIIQRRWRVIKDLEYDGASSADDLSEDLDDGITMEEREFAAEEAHKDFLRAKQALQGSAPPLHASGSDGTGHPRARTFFGRTIEPQRRPTGAAAPDKFARSSPGAFGELADDEADRRRGKGKGDAE